MQIILVTESDLTVSKLSTGFINGDEKKFFLPLRRKMYKNYGYERRQVSEKVSKKEWKEK